MSLLSQFSFHLFLGIKDKKYLEINNLFDNTAIKYNITIKTILPDFNGSHFSISYQKTFKVVNEAGENGVVLRGRNG